MATREELHKRFGPLLLEAAELVNKDEINILRQHLGLPERTGQQALDAIENKLNQLSEYEWMH